MHKVVNASGQLAFHAFLTGGSSTSGLFVGTPGTVQAVALQGSPAPAGGNYDSFFLSRVLLNGAGQVAFGANLAGGSATQGLFAGALGALRAVALQGAPAPGANGALYSDFQFTNPVVNGNGLVAFIATLSGAGVTTANNEALFAGPPGAIQLVVRKGDQVNLGPGLGARTVFDMAITPGSGGEDGNPLALNDSGRLIYFLDFTDNSTGVFTSTIPVPEPSSGVLALLALLGLARFRRRGGR